MAMQHAAMHTSDPIGAHTASTRGSYADMCIYKKKVGSASHHVFALCVTQTAIESFHRLDKHHITYKSGYEVARLKNPQCALLVISSIYVRM